MNNEQLTAYLKDESYLYTLSYEEIKTLVVQYPYANNLRILLLKKSFIEQNKDYERNLQMAAAYSTNRRFLYKMVQKLSIAPRVPENVILGEDYLELTELSNIEKMLSERHVTQVFSEETFSFAGSDSVENWAEIGVNDRNSDALIEEKGDIPEISDMTILEPNAASDVEAVTLNTDNNVTESALIVLNNAEIDVEKPIDLTAEKNIEIPIENGLPNIEMPIFEEVEEAHDIIDLTKPLSSQSLSNVEKEEVFTEENIQKVDFTIESILAEFGSLALDFSGKLPQLSDENQPTIAFQSIEEDNNNSETEVIDDIIDDNIEQDIPKDPPDEEANTPLDWGVEDEAVDYERLEDNQSMATVEESQAVIVEDETKYFEELNNAAEFNENQLSSKDKTFDFDDLDFIDRDDFQQEDDSIIENVIKETPQYITKVELGDIYSVHNDMKKPAIEIEIVNQSKAVVVESEQKPPVATSQVSFKEWLRQYKVNPKPIVEVKTEPSTPIVHASDAKLPEDKVVSPKIVTTENKHVLDENILSMLFEAPSDLPDNLFGLNDVTFGNKKATNEDAKEDDSYFEKLLNGEDDDSPKKKKKKKKQMHELAAKSIIESDDLISETLADILAWQGNNKKAIEMYEQLRLQFPEKNDYFAAKIENLRNTDIQ